jgi:LysM repeat protein
VDAARLKDNKALVDELARQLATLGANARPLKPAATGDAREHVVQKGETLTAIARAHGVSVAALRKANNLASDALAVGQKLAIPEK